MNMKQKKLMVMTSFGPVPFEAIKEHLPAEIQELMDAEKDNIMKAINSAVPMCISYYICSLAKKMGWKPEKMSGYLSNLWDINPMAAVTVLLREIAVELDKKYEDHIENSEKIYIFSTLDGRVHEVVKAYIKNYRNFAAFRTIEDARIACRILRDALKSLFSDRK